MLALPGVDGGGSKSRAGRDVGTVRVEAAMAADTPGDKRFGDGSVHQELFDAELELIGDAHVVSSWRGGSRWSLSRSSDTTVTVPPKSARDHPHETNTDPGQGFGAALGGVASPRSGPGGSIVTAGRPREVAPDILLEAAQGRSTLGVTESDPSQGRRSFRTSRNSLICRHLLEGECAPWPKRSQESGSSRLRHGRSCQRRVQFSPIGAPTSSRWNIPRQATPNEDSSRWA